MAPSDGVLCVRLRLTCMMPLGCRVRIAWGRRGPFDCFSAGPLARRNTSRAFGQFKFQMVIMMPTRIVLSPTLPLKTPQLTSQIAVGVLQQTLKLLIEACVSEAVGQFQGLDSGAQGLRGEILTEGLG